MKYVGSKNRISKDLLNIMLPYRGNRVWVEPFVGGGNMIDKVTGDRLGSDANADVIGALMFIRDHLDKIPKNNLEFTESMYKNLRNREESMLNSFAGFAYSFGAKWLGGWSRSGNRDYVNEAHKNAVKQSPKLQGVDLVCRQYYDLDIPASSLIYCDPPYRNTTRYAVGGFDHDNFFEWCRNMKQKGHIVFVSEYQAPDDFECLWQGQIKTNFASKRTEATHVAVERLFKV